MNLSHIPTPINDQFTLFMNGADDSTHLVALDLLSRDLERRLTVARDALEYIAKPSDGITTWRLQNVAKEALTITAPKQ